ncbi:MAG: transcription-repair coupling factor [Clostridia bacterium]|nr:transcription-repair coupling factor [Clostridia bacterium]
MYNEFLVSSIKEAPQYSALFSRLKELKGEKTPLPLLVDGVSDGAMYSLLYSLLTDLRSEYKKTILVLVGEERRANKLNEFFKKCGVKSEFYPIRDFNFYNLTASHDLEHERLKVLSGVLFGSCDVVFTTPDALLQYTMPKSRLESGCINVNLDTSLDVSLFSRKLFEMGYTSCELVEGAGQYSIRGDIIDIFPTKCEYTIGKKVYTEQKPIRIELFGDEIERIATFDPLTQRASDKVSSFKITPSREIVATSEQLDKISAEIEELISYAASEEAENQLKRELATIKSGGSSHPFFDKYISLIYPEKECLLSYFDDGSTIIICDTNSVSSKASESKKEENEIVTALIGDNLVPTKYTEFSAPVSLIDQFTKRIQTVNVDTYIMSSFSSLGGIYHFNTKGTSFANHSLNMIFDELKYFSDNNYKSVLVCQSPQEAKRAVKILNETEIPATYLKSDTDEGAIERGVISVTTGAFPSGFEIPEVKLAIIVLSSKEAREKKKSFKNKPFAKNAGEKILSHADLNVGDLVVHISYGIGRYLGIQNLCVMGTYKDYIAIQYAGTDKLFLPVDQLDMVAKYIGAGSLDGDVKLSKMNGAEWKKSTQRAKKAAQDMAKELIDLYARRQRIDGFAFAEDSLMEEEFASSFEYEETDAQKVAINDILGDMQKPYPMDRVLCGDVGYGKTEVAFRAAMKAVANNKQVAILVPTTILAMQHYQTALSRFAGTGVNVGMISRFRTTKEQNATLRSLRRGDLDIIIGTHKLLSKSIEFKDLGLLIIDEEQRFGVGQKEKIKQAWPDVDVLTLSATPIPRTLSMAIGGIRDLSVLDEAPEGRVGVVSYVLEHDKKIIFDAIKRELHRGGQVFYLNNDIKKIYHTAVELQKEFPNATVAVGHGQMEREELEEIWHSLVKGDIDILICTTIIETGIDIPNANTLIIENADKMGLAQLHQIRGRVGRSHRRAYAFFTYRRGKEISEIASKRLNAIRDFAEFGAGFKIAMRDLEIRGAGNLLGSAQHGHLDAVGYDLYIKLLNEAVLEEKGIAPKEAYETKISTCRDAFIPEKYIPSSTQRIELYKKIAHIENEEDRADILNELKDRFGKVPTEADTLVYISLIKAYAQKCKIKKVEELRGEIRLYPELMNLPLFVEISNFDRAHISVIGVGKVPYFCVKCDTGSQIYEKTIQLLKFYIEKSENP